MSLHTPVLVGAARRAGRRSRGPGDASAPTRSEPENPPIRLATQQQENLMRALTLTDHDSTPSLTDVDIPQPARVRFECEFGRPRSTASTLQSPPGSTKDFMEHRFPLVLGKDFAGDVEAVGPGRGGTTQLATACSVSSPSPSSATARSVTTSPFPPRVGLAKLPAGGLRTPTAPRSAWPGRPRRASSTGWFRRPARRSSSWGATGGVGTQVVQLAKAAGARVIATAHTGPGA